MVTSQTLPPDSTSTPEDFFSESATGTTDKPAPPDPQQLKSAVPKTSGWLTRDESARLLGVSVQTIKNYEKRGLLRPLREPREDSTGREQLVTVHDPRELVRIRETLQSEPNAELDTSTWLTRNEATDALSISIQTLKNYEQRGMLNPRRVTRRDKRGHDQKAVVYDPKELAKLPRGIGRCFSPREDGELTARCFELIEQGKTNREIIIQLRVTVDRIRVLREDWLNTGGASFMITNEAKHALELVLGPFASTTELVDLITAKLKTA